MYNQKRAVWKRNTLANPQNLKISLSMWMDTPIFKNMKSKNF